ncbi:unnamed protein product [Soboliphyme baturini]|uniref:RPAP1_N domain-containing protein n=1 Tax=Soboliphyme baturini TaxID=241478 RepID=A0A183IT26_9BILA|nr:unnamed protein product [Soboliphyme baturini]
MLFDSEAASRNSQVHAVKDEQSSKSTAIKEIAEIAFDQNLCDLDLSAAPTKQKITKRDFTSDGGSKQRAVLKSDVFSDLDVLNKMNKWTFRSDTN